MPKKLSVDEIVSRRKDLGAGAITKAAKSPASWNKDSRSARFVMNAQAPDRYGDVVVTAGINTAEFEKNPVALLFHSSRTWPVGTWGNLEKVLKGRPPRIEGDLMLLPEGGPVAEIDQTAWMIENGGVRACSIGFRPNWDEAEMILDEEGKWTGGIQWNASELLEASIVAVPASPQSLIKDAAGDWKLARELIEEVLDSYARTPEGLLLPKADYEKAYRLTVEKIAEDTVAPVEPAAEGATEKDAQDAPEAADAPEVEKEAEAAVDKDTATPAATEPEAKGMDLITDEVLDAFAALMKGDCNIQLTDEHAEIKLLAFENGKDVEVAELVLPVDLTVAQIKEVQASIWQRVNAAKTAPEPEKKTLDAVVIDVDTTEATEKVNALSKLFDSLAEKMNRFFGTKAVEPEVVEPPAPPSAEAIEAAKSKAAAIRDRLAAKGLIEA